MPELSLPPVLRGTREDQLLSVRSYLFRLVDELNGALDTINAGNIELQRTVSVKADTKKVEEARQSIRSEAERLRELIINTQNIVTEYQENVGVDLAEIRSGYEVLSNEFGTYSETTSQRITTAEKSIVDNLEYTSTLISDMNSALSTDINELSVHVSGMIRIGIVDYDDLVPQVGIAIGQNVTETGSTETVDGIVYNVLNKGSYSSVFTADKLAFYNGDNMVAYINSNESNGALMISRANVLNELDIGQWSWTHNSNGLTLKWAGG